MKCTILVCVGTAVLLFLVSFYWNNDLFNFLLFFFRDGNLLLQATEVNGYFLLALKLSFSIAMVPLLLLITWKLDNIVLPRKRLLSILILMGSIVIGFSLNVLRIQSQVRTITNFNGKISFPIENLNFDITFFAATVTGCVLAYLALGRKTGKELDAGINKINFQ